jgi:hypothetical protein
LAFQLFINKKAVYAFTSEDRTVKIKKAALDPPVLGNLALFGRLESLKSHESEP